MEPHQKKNYILLMIGFVAAVIIIMYVFSLRTQLQEVRANQRNYEEKIASLSSIQNTDALINYLLYKNGMEFLDNSYLKDIGVWLKQEGNYSFNFKDGHTYIS
ncbi:hypothetical protein [Bacillus sp. ISL-46]|uniref:hypothetical protein n=1 Tax=Bacillus sp. ISL-46 TaxID=2819129 RepID=UPI001BEC5221|nr:hypothetical protein [Bacillus sp. ISL-46]MBT2724857.1 hypothetical protein [Bacillus sp. ISL-46]